MPSTLPRSEATATAPGSVPICSCSRSLHPLDVQASTEQLSREPVWSEEPTLPPYAGPSPFALDPQLCNHAFLLNDSGHGVQAGGAIHLLSQQFLPNVDPRIDPRMLQQVHHEYGCVAVSTRPDSQLLHDHQMAVADQRGQSIGWNTGDLVLRSSPLPRQRSAKACRKCRKRKTKCSGGQPCTRCVARGLECEYDERSTLRSPTRPHIEIRRKLLPKVVIVESRTQTQNNDRDQSSDAPGCTDKIPSVMQPTPASTISVAASDETSQPLVVRPDIVPALNDPMRLGSDPERAQFVGAESPSESASVSDSAELSLIRGYIAPDNQDPIMQLPCTVHGQWPVAARVNISDISHMSRPPSACSSSSDASGYTLSSDTSFTSDASSTPAAWTAVASESNFNQSSAFSRMLSSSASSSSLQNALVERPRRRAFSQTSRLAGPSSGAADALISVLSHASLAGSEYAMPETSPAQGTPGTHCFLPCARTPSAGSALAWDMASQPPAPADAFKLEDVFNFAPDQPALDGGCFDEPASRANTVKARVGNAAPQSLSAISASLSLATPMDLDAAARTTEGFSYTFNLFSSSELDPTTFMNA